MTSREALDEILSEDVYFPSGAAYEVMEFTAVQGIPAVAGLLER